MVEQECRVHKNGNYTVMSNTHFKEKEMSLKAKGLLSLMLSLPEDWDYSITGLATLSKDGKDSVTSALQELETFCYLKRTKKLKDNGQFDGYEYDIYETPYTEKPCAEKPYTENPDTVQDNIYNILNNNIYTIENNKLNTNKLNTNKKENNKRKNDFETIIAYLNEKAGTFYKATTKETQRLIHARLIDGFTVDDFKTVIDKKCADWKGTEWEQYLRPATLFGTKFESYLNGKQHQRQETPKQDNSQQAYWDKLCEDTIIGG